MTMYGFIGLGGVASQSITASLAGYRVLLNGGNAFDASLAISSVLSVILPHTGGLGGDGFLLARTANGEIIAYNGSGVAPKNYPIDEYIREKPLRGPYTITVPGLVDLWEWMCSNYCSRDPRELLEPAISLAKNGFYVQEQLAKAIKYSYPELARYNSWVDTYGGLEKGSYARFPRLASVLETLAVKGFREFYEGRLAEEIVNELSLQKVPVVYEDFVEYRGEPIDPIKTVYRGYEVLELPPNTQGIATLELLKLMEITDLNKREFNDLSRIEEFFKLAMIAYSDRDKYVADPRHYSLDPHKLLDERELAKKLGMNYSSESSIAGGDTTFFVVGDREGNIVGFIQSLFYPFGSGIVVKDMAFQNRATGFTPDKKHPNSPAPGKRPMHTLSIMYARGDEVEYVIGCAGGHLRPQIHVEILANIVDYGMDLQEAVNAPRYMLVKWDSRGFEAVIEENIIPRNQVVDEKHYRVVEPYSRRTGIVQALKYEPKKRLYEFSADPRGGGLALAHG